MEVVVLGEVEDGSEVVEKLEKVGLFGEFWDVMFLAKLAVTLVGNIVFVKGFEFLFELEPGFGDGVVDVGEFGDDVGEGFD